MIDFDFIFICQTHQKEKKTYPQRRMSIFFSVILSKFPRMSCLTNLRPLVVSICYYNNFLFCVCGLFSLFPDRLERRSVDHLKMEVPKETLETLEAMLTIGISMKRRGR